MRIIAGRFRSRAIAAPSGSRTRPTTDRVREALFSMIQSRIELNDARILDLYAGSGALGLESISRGARHVIFVEQNRSVANVLRANIETLGVEDETAVIRGSVDSFLKNSADAFDLILADPPYADRDVGQLPDKVMALIAPGGIAAIEHAKTTSFTGRPGVILERDFGQTRITLFQPVSSNE